MKPEDTRLLTISGSLRAGSSNSALLAAAAALAPAGVTVASYDAIAALPAFSPDLDEPDSVVPDPVAHWRAALAAADAVLISSPEYAHGVPGSLKNALDWVVGSGELVNKPVGLLSGSSASRFAHPQLVEILTVMNSALVHEATLVIDIPRRGADAAALLEDPSVAASLRSVVAALARACSSEISA